ncbi:hypothetical protein [Nocardioides okcheonensis]|uniref:hypothetical protein n=1 Tax=Nocardioides okcheonensis TaxID=2894081 RepID=UPI001E50E8A1|nr:hypothetical protein [Nocardioides okcheonensis]UFN46438.1 hypothetical protein LN652_09610 [Nocardioides okcheonensis]
MSDHANAGTSEGHEADEPSIADIIAGPTWEELTSDGIITLDELDSMIRAKGGDPSAYDPVPVAGGPHTGTLERLESVLDLVVELDEAAQKARSRIGNSMPTARSRSRWPRS